MNPTTNNLAALAVSLSTGTPDERAEEALAVWNACDRLLTQRAYIDGGKLADEMESRRQGRERSEFHLDMMRVFGVGADVSLDEILKFVMPKTNTSDRMAKYRKWRKAEAKDVHRLEGDEIDKYAAESIAKGRAGLRFNDAELWAFDFSKWISLDRKKVFSERGKKGLAAKKSLEAEKLPKNRTSKPSAAIKRATNPSKRATNPSKRK